jgi:polysaccharide biosynthesis transport protein
MEQKEYIFMEQKEYIEEFDFQKYWLVLKRRWPVATCIFAASICLTALGIVFQKPVYEATGKLLVREGHTSSLTGLNVDIGDLNALDSPFNKKDPLSTQAEILKSMPIVQKAIAVTKTSDVEQTPTPSELIEDLEVKALPGTDILQISYQSSDPKSATNIVNALMNAYIGNNVETNRGEATAARQFIANQLPQTEAAVSAAEANLRKFKEQNGVIALDQEATQAVNNIGNLNTQIDEARAELADVSARLLALQRQLRMNPDVATDLNTLSQSPGVQEVLTELQKVQSQLAIERARYQDTHPTVRNLQRQVNSLNSLLHQRVAAVTDHSQQLATGNLQLGELQQNLIAEYLQSEVSRVGLSQRIAELSHLQSLYRSRASTLPALEKSQRELERRLKAAQTTYEALLNKLQEVQVAENQNVGNARVIEAAIAPEKPVGPRSKLILIAGGVVGLLLGVAAVFLLDLLDRSVKTLKECREEFGYTLLGVIPAFDEMGRLRKSGSHVERTPLRIMNRDMPSSIVGEAYQMLQSNLKFISASQDLKTIVITSSVAGEGKSEVAANLAVAIAQVGRRVLLVDADMRHPSMHKAWHIPNRTGLSHVLASQGNVNEAIQNVMLNLDVFPAGVIPPNPIALLDSPQMESLMVELSEQYDFIILDTSPVSCADASVLGRMADGTVMVVRPEMLTMAVVNAAKERLVNTEQKVLGMVVNALDVRNEPDSYFYFTYYAQDSTMNSSDTATSNRTISKL